VSVTAFRKTFPHVSANNFVAYCRVIWGLKREAKQGAGEIRREVEGGRLMLNR
jgi:hypothetical protein